MTLRTIENATGKILIIGSIYDKLKTLSKVGDMISCYEHIIFNGNLLFPFNDIESIKHRIQIMDELLKNKNVIYNIGNYDLKLLNILNENNDHYDVQKWILSKPNIIAIDFANTYSVLIVSGGLTPNIKTRSKLIDNLEISFVSNINDNPWQIYYGGRLGYVISNNPATTDKPKLFPYASQIGNKYSENSKVYAQEIDQLGLNQIIQL
jgi:hypothetical protein